MRKCIALISAVLLIISMALPTRAYGEKEHCKIIELILFGDEDYKRNKLSKDVEKNNALQALENAVTICLDQFNNSHSDRLEFLNKTMKIHGLPKKIGEIDFDSSGRDHRMYTHQGWNYLYGVQIPNRAKWSVRKTLLLQTVNKVFGFSDRAGKGHFPWFLKDYGYTPQCDSMAAFLYYLHIVGEYDQAAKDIENGKDAKSAFSTLIGNGDGKGNKVIPLANPNPSSNNPDLFWELKHHLAILFEDQHHKDTYIGLNTDLNILASKARELVSSDGTIPEKDFFEYAMYATELIKLLHEKIPGLLQNEKFFTNVFPTQAAAAS